MARRGIELLRGTLDMLVLQTLRGGALHGYAIAKDIQQATDAVLSVEEGSLYPALYRMERRGWIDAAWGRTDTKRRAKFYRLTPAGRAHLEAELSTWGEFTSAVGKVLEGR